MTIKRDRSLFGPLLILVLFAVRAKGDAPKDTPKKEPARLAPEAGDLSGIYRCEGKEGAGETCTGVVTIHRRGEVYVVAWLVNGASFTGIGIRQNETLAVGWGMASEKGLVRGVNVYKVGAKTMAGRWATIPGGGTVNSETLTWIAGHAQQTEESP